METSIPQNVSNGLHEVQERLGPQIEEARQELTELNRRATSWIKKNPGTALLAGLAVGFLIGKIASR